VTHNQGIKVQYNPHKAIDLFDTKEYCLMHAESAKEIADHYTNMDPQILKSISVAGVRNAKATKKDIALAVQKLELAEIQKGRMKKKVKDRQNYQRLAANAVIIFDRDFENISQETMQLRKDILRLTELSFWSGLRVKKDNFFEELKNTMPKFWEFAAFGEILPSKTKVLEKLKLFLEKVVECSTMDGESVMSPFEEPENISSLDRWNRLERYIKVEKCRKLESKKELARGLSSIFDTMGTVVANNGCYKIDNDYYDSDLDSD